MRSPLAMSFGETLELHLVSGEEPPESTEAVVVAQDVHLILGELTEVEEEPVPRTPAQALSEAVRQRPRRRGTVLARPAPEGHPLRLEAIVYDFDDQPPTRESFVFEALMAAFEEAGTRGLASLAVQPVGTEHSGIEPRRFLAVLTQVCYSSVELGTSLRRVHLLVPSPGELQRYETLLRELAADHR